MDRSWQKELDVLLEELKGRKDKPSLLLHACCAPCSSYVLEYLAEYFRITVFFYNPNIEPFEEYERRRIELEEFLQKLPKSYELIVGEYDNHLYREEISGHENNPEGGERCFLCYRMRMRETVKYAEAKGFDYFATTLSLSPHKNEIWINAIGESYATKLCKHLPSDFKKKNGYKRSLELSAEYDLYRQDYCGCIFSREEREKTKQEKQNYPGTTSKS